MRGIDSILQVTPCAPSIGLDTIDLFFVAKLLQPQYSQYSLCQLARKVAEAAVLQGYTSFSWERQDKGCSSPNYACRVAELP